MCTQKLIAVYCTMLLIAGCAGQTAGVSRNSAPAAGAADCAVNTVKICGDAQNGGTLEPPPAPMGYVASQSTMPDTARIAIPNGPTVQVMCYYNPQHTSLAKSDWTSSTALDQSAVGYLKSKGYCSNP